MTDTTDATQPRLSVVPPKEPEVTYNVEYWDVYRGKSSDSQYSYDRVPRSESYVGYSMVAGNAFVIHTEQGIPLFIVPVDRVIRVTTDIDYVESTPSVEAADVSNPQ